MKNVQLVATFVLLLGLTAANAQTSWGVKAGASLSTTYGKPEKMDGNNIESVALRPGFQVGIWKKAQFTEGFGLLGELNFEQRNGRKNVDFNQSIGTEAGNIMVETHAEIDNSFNYLNLPLTAVFGREGGVQFYAGPNFGYLLRATGERTTDLTVDLPQGLPSETPGIPKTGITTTEINYIDDYEDGEPFIHRFEIGMNAGVLIPFTTNLMMDVRLNHGLTDVTNNNYDRSILDQSERSDNDRNISIQLGLAYRF